MAISLNRFIEENLGKKLNIPTPNPDPDLLGQCVSLVQQYLDQCLDIPFEIRGHAKEWVNLSSNIAKVVTDGHKAGDIIVFPDAGVINGKIYGHIGIVISSTEIFEQNVSPNKVAEKRSFTAAVNRSGKYVLMRPVKALIEDIPLTGIYLNSVTTPFKVRKSPVTGNQIDLILVGRQVQILAFGSGFQSDGYQWAKVKTSNGAIGYSQLDLKNDYKIVKSASSSVSYLKAITSGFYILDTPVTGAVKTTVPRGYKAQIISYETSHATDEYQWAKVDYNGTIGYSQIDTQGFNQLSE